MSFERTEAKDIRFSFSSLRLMDKCGEAYRLRYTPPRHKGKVQDNYYAIEGIVIQKMFEKFYNDEWWKNPTTVMEKMEGKLPSVFEKVLEKEPVSWTHPKQNRMTREEMFASIQKMIPFGMEVIKHHKLLGPFARSEVKMAAWYKKKYQLNGYADFVIKKDDGKGGKEYIILDGKAVRKRKSPSVDKRQLYWYSLMAALRWNILPTKIGFWYYKPEVAGSVEDAIEWIPVSKEDIKVLMEDIDLAVKRVYKDEWEPNQKACFNCSVAYVCEHNKYAPIKIDLPNPGSGIISLA